MSPFVSLQHVLPQHMLSRGLGKLAECEIPAVKDFLIEKFIQRYKVDMSEAKFEQASDYKNFNEFFTRELKDGLRPIDDSNTIVCPADGRVSQCGDIQDGTIFQAKGHEFSCLELLGGDKISAAQFNQGRFATIYLSPKDYHRVHMPFQGTLRKMIHIPGRLFSVNTQTTAEVPRLFARNERVACIFDTRIGPIAMVLVGAMVVASIETVWAGTVAPPNSGVSEQRYGDHADISIRKGEEVGRFKLGSTVVLLMPPNSGEWLEDFKAEAAVKMGEPIGSYQIKTD